MVNKPYHVAEKQEFYHDIPKAKTTWIPHCETGDRPVLGVVDYFSWFLYFKGHNVLFEIFTLLTTKANLRYNRNELQYRLFCISQPFSSFCLHLGLGTMSSFLDPKHK